MSVVPPSTKMFVVWCTDATTEFLNGCLDGILVGSGGGIIATAQTDTTAPGKLFLHGIVGFMAGMGLSGLTAFKVWHKTNRIPNPFRNYDIHPTSDDHLPTP